MFIERKADTCHCNWATLSIGPSHDFLLVNLSSLAQVAAANFSLLSSSLCGAMMAHVITLPTYSPISRSNNRELNKFQRHVGRTPCIKAIRAEKSLEELYNIRVERKVTSERLNELGVSRWSLWKTGKCRLPWDWHVDQLVYIEEGEVRVVPEGSKRYMSFKAGDLIRYPKWFEADLWFNDFYQERYSFRAYGDD